MTEHTLKDVQRMLEIAVTMLEKIQEREDTSPDAMMRDLLSERRKVDLGISARQYRHFHVSDGVEPRRKGDPGAEKHEPEGEPGDGDDAVPEVLGQRDTAAC